MTDDGTITNRMLLEHIHASKYEMLQHMRSFRQELSQKIDLLEQKVGRGFANVDRRFTDVYQKLDDAHLHRDAIQQDLDATIRMQAAHHTQLAAIGRKKSKGQ